LDKRGTAFAEGGLTTKVNASHMTLVLGSFFRDPLDARRVVARDVVP